jgi:hypothetical protein
MRIVATSGERLASAIDVLERFGSSAHGERVHPAALGQMIRAVYSREHFTSPELPRRAPGARSR